MDYVLHSVGQMTGSGKLGRGVSSTAIYVGLCFKEWINFCPISPSKKSSSRYFQLLEDLYIHYLPFLKSSERGELLESSLRSHSILAFQSYNSYLKNQSKEKVKNWFQSQARNLPRMTLEGPMVLRKILVTRYSNPRDLIWAKLANEVGQEQREITHGGLSLEQTCF